MYGFLKYKKFKILILNQICKSLAMHDYTIINKVRFLKDDETIHSLPHLPREVAYTNLKWDENYTYYDSIR